MRGRGEGSISQLSNGSWMAQVSVTTSGKRVRRTVYGKTKEDARGKLKEMHAQTDRKASSKETLGEYLDRWLATMVVPSLKPNTAVAYQGTVNLHIKPYVGDVPLAKFGPEHFFELRERMVAAGESTHALWYAHVVLRRALNQAVDPLRILPRNPILGIKPVAHVKAETYVWDEEQVRTFLEKTTKDRINPLVHFAISTGARSGELLGLQRADINLTERYMDIKNTLVECAGVSPTLMSPKTKAGARRITLSELDVAVYKRHLATLMAEGLLSSPYAFPATRGRPYFKSEAHRAFKQATRTAGVPEIRFHDLRHTSATLLLKAGVPAHVVQKRLGHSHISITLGIYGHVLPSQQKEAADKLEGMLK